MYACVDKGLCTTRNTVNTMSTIYISLDSKYNSKIVVNIRANGWGRGKTQEYGMA